MAETMTLAPTGVTILRPMLRVGRHEILRYLDSIGARFVSDSSNAHQGFLRNRVRMDYPRYRREGLPVTSSLAESLVKQISKRVKGTEKIWDDGPRGEAILQIRAAVVSQDQRLARFFRDRPISPYSPRCRSSTLATAA